MKRISFLLIAAAGILWGSMGLFVRTLNTAGLETMDIVFLRALVTGAGMLGYLAICKPSLLKIRLRDFWCFLGTGIASIVFFNFCYFRAITLTSLSVAAVLLYTAPAMVMVMSWFLFKEALTGRKIIALVMTVAGCVLVTGVLKEGNTLTAGGILLGLGAGFGYALYSIFTRYALERGYHSLTITCYTFLIAAAAAVPLSHSGFVMQVAFSSWGMGAFSLAFGLLCTVAPYLLYTIGLKYTDNSKASILASVEPVTAAVLGVIVFHESLTAMTVLGMVLVLAGMAVCSSRTKREKTSV